MACPLFFLAEDSPQVVVLLRPHPITAIQYIASNTRLMLNTHERVQSLTRHQNDWCQNCLLNLISSYSPTHHKLNNIAPDVAKPKAANAKLPLV